MMKWCKKRISARVKVSVVAEMACGTDRLTDTMAEEPLSSRFLTCRSALVG